MEDVVVYVKDASGFSELGGVPVVMRWKYRGLKGSIYTEDVSFLIMTKLKTLSLD